MSSPLLLSKKQPLIAGVCLFVTSVIFLAVRIDNDELLDIQIGKVKTQDDVIKVHNKLSNNRKGLLTSAAFLYLTLPLLLFHIYYMENIFKIMFEKIPIGRFFYTWSWIIEMCILCVVVSPCIIISCYYNWKFNDNNSTIYTGYYIQLLMVHFIIVLADGVYIVAAVTAVIPWLTMAAVIWDQEYNYKILDHILPCSCGKKKIISIYLILWCVVVFFCAVSGTFDFAGSGFFSIYGKSQYLPAMILVSYYILCVWLFFLISKVHQINTINEYDVVTMGEEELVSIKM